MISRWFLGREQLIPPRSWISLNWKRWQPCSPAGILTVFIHYNLAKDEYFQKNVSLFPDRTLQQKQLLDLWLQRQQNKERKTLGAHLTCTLRSSGKVIEQQADSRSKHAKNTNTHTNMARMTGWVENIPKRSRVVDQLWQGHRDMDTDGA